MFSGCLISIFCIPTSLFVILSCWDKFSGRIFFHLRNYENRSRFDQCCRSFVAKSFFRHRPPIQHDHVRHAAKAGQSDDRSEGPESGLLRSLPPESGGQGEEHVHLHGLHPDRDEDDPRLVRRASRSGGHGSGNQLGSKQKKCSGKNLIYKSWYELTWFWED